jgi:hypothetical protein
MNNSIGSGNLNYTYNNLNSIDPLSNSPKNTSFNNKSPILFAKVNIQENDESSLITKVNVNSISPSLVSYKKISIKDSDRTKDIKRLILSKF